MSYPWTVYKTWVTGEVLTAGDLNTSFTTAVTNSDPTSINDYSPNAASMRSVADPYPGSVESLATTLSGELERIRYVIAQITGQTYWYQDPPVALSLTPTLTSETLTATSNQLVLGTTRTVTVTAPTPASSSRTWTIPDISGNGTFMALEGIQTNTGAKTFASSTLLLQEAGSTDVATIAVATLATGRTYTVPDAGTNASFVMTEGTQTINGTVTFGGQLIGKGTATNNDAAAGYIGEVVRSQTGTGVSATGTGQWFDVTSISLSAGDWDLSCVVSGILNSATSTRMKIGMSSTSGNSTTGLVEGDNLGEAPPPLSAANCITVLPGFRVSLSGSTTYYLKAYYDYSAGTPKAMGRISARRAR